MATASPPVEGRRALPLPPSAGGRPRPGWWVDAATLLAAGLALGIALLGPRLIPDTDPVGIDPFSVRLAVAVLLLLAAGGWVPRLRPALPALVAVAAVVLPFVLWAAVPRALTGIAGGRIGFRAEVLWANVLQLVLTLGLCGLALRLAPAGLRPRLRLGGGGWRAAAAGAGLVVALLGVALLLPATLLGREGIAVQAVARDLPLLGPAYVLQAAAQEVQFRGLLLGTLERAAPPWLANLGQASLFGLAHIAVQYEGPAGPFVPVTVGLGLVLGWVTQRVGSIWPAIAVHAVAELVVAVAVLDGLYGY